MSLEKGRVREEINQIESRIIDSIKTQREEILTIIEEKSTKLLGETEQKINDYSEEVAK